MREPADIQLRGTVLLGLVLCGMLLLLGRLFQLQILSQADWSDRSVQNRVRSREIPAHRGLLLDRGGAVLVDNRPSYTVFGVPAILLGDSSVVHRLAQECGAPAESMFGRLARGGSRSMRAIRLLADIDFDTRVALAENLQRYPGVEVQIDPKRHYPVTLAPHALGYLGEITDQELKSARAGGADPGDLVGRKGIERTYDGQLRGQKGVEYITVNARGIAQGPAEGMPPREPQHGKDLLLTLDRGLQELAEELLGERRGVALLMDCRTGALLASASAPDYPLELFSGRMPPETWARLSSGEQRPLLNRVIQGLYPPGSLFKIAVAAYALESGVVDERFSVTCTGAYKLGRRIARCWKPEGHGLVDMHQALVQSCDVWFYQVGLKMNPDEIHSAAEVFHLTRATGVDIAGEQEGLVPDTDWFDSHLGRAGWTVGVMLNLAIGQGEILLTPLQMLNYAALVANRGWSVAPHFGSRLVDRFSGETEIPGFPRFETSLSERSWRMIEETTRGVVEHPAGTAHHLMRTAYSSAGKTGTAENPQGDPHSLYMGWMPEPDPEVAALVLVENAGHGSDVAAPIAFRLFDAYWDLRPGAGTSMVEASKEP